MEALELFGGKEAVKNRIIIDVREKLKQFSNDEISLVCQFNSLDISLTKDFIDNKAELSMDIIFVFFQILGLSLMDSFGNLKMDDNLLALWKQEMEDKPVVVAASCNDDIKSKGIDVDIESYIMLRARAELSSL